jgi:hypothetical protein
VKRALFAVALPVAVVGAAPPGALAQARYAARAQDQTDTNTAPLAAPLLSAVLPGAGQHVLGQKRKWAYLALEVVGWTAYFERRAAGGTYRDRYRDFAWDQARVQSATRVDGDFAYYETLRKWARSGAFDADAGLAGVQPEDDPTTYNGSIWSLASGIFLPGGAPVPETDPAYRAALGYYQGRAYDADMLWDWSSTSDGQGEFARLIDASDDRFRQATTALGVVIANHLLSVGDAYLSARGRASPARLRILPVGPAPGPAWAAVLTMSVGG